MAYCKASSRATYSATLLSWCPIHLAMRIGPSAQPSIITPIPDGPGLPRQPPSTYATRSDIETSRYQQDALRKFRRQDDFLVRTSFFYKYTVLCNLLCKI